MSRGEQVAYGRATSAPIADGSGSEELVQWASPTRAGMPVSIYLEARVIEASTDPRWPLQAVEALVRVGAGRGALRQYRVGIAANGTLMTGTFSRVSVSIGADSAGFAGGGNSFEVTAAVAEGVTPVQARLVSGWDDAVASDDIEIPPFVRTLQIDTPDPLNGDAVQPLTIINGNAVLVPNTVSLPMGAFGAAPVPIDPRATHYRVTPGPSGTNVATFLWGF